MMQERSNILKGSSNRIDTSQLLLIVSDGRGIFLEGKEVFEIRLHSVIRVIRVISDLSDRIAIARICLSVCQCPSSLLINSLYSLCANRALNVCWYFLALFLLYRASNSQTSVVFLMDLNSK